MTTLYVELTCLYQRNELSGFPATGMKTFSPEVVTTSLGHSVRSPDCVFASGVTTKSKKISSRLGTAKYLFRVQSKFSLVYFSSFRLLFRRF